jgi:hypothetical protein
MAVSPASAQCVAPSGKVHSKRNAFAAIEPKPEFRESTTRNELDEHEVSPVESRLPKEMRQPAKCERTFH